MNRCSASASIGPRRAVDLKILIAAVWRYRSILLRSRGVMVRLDRRGEPPAVFDEAVGFGAGESEA